VDLATTDPAGAKAFYSGFFDWEMEPIEEGGKLAYVVIKNAGSSNGGIVPMTEQPGEGPSHWLAYFTVPSCGGCREAAGTGRGNAGRPARPPGW
jgi:uncharacterized protein